MGKHRISGLDSTYGNESYSGLIDGPGMDVLDARNGTDTWYKRYTDYYEQSAEAIVSIVMEEVA